MISIIITSFTDFGDMTTPLIKSILKYERGHEIIVIDNGSKTPYPIGGDYKVFRFSEPHSWAKMLNKGAELAKGDWLLILNDDVLCSGWFSNTIEGLDKRGFYGPKLKKKPPEWAGVEIYYMQLWAFTIQKTLYEKLGGMDEWYPKAGVDDIDFCWRAHQKGIPFTALNLPFIHLEQYRRTKWDGFDEQMKKSIEHLSEKIRS